MRIIPGSPLSNVVSFLVEGEVYMCRALLDHLFFFLFQYADEYSTTPQPIPSLREYAKEPRDVRSLRSVFPIKP